MAKLVEFCKINMGQSPDSSSYNDIGKGMPFFQGNADFGNIHPKVRVWCDAPTKIAHPNDILISVRAPIGALNIANIKCCIGRGLASLTADEHKCHQKYLWYALESKVDELNSKGTGSTFKAISKSVLIDTEIPLPSLDTQKAISDIFDRITSLIADRKRQLKDLENLVKSRFIELFGEVGTDTKGWGLTRLGDCCSINPKKGDDKRLNQGLTVSFVPMPSVSEKGEIDASDTKLYDEVKSGFTYFAEQDVLFAKITPCMENGKGAVAKGLCNGIGFGSTEFHVLRPIEGVSNPYWIYTVTAFNQFRVDAANNMTGSAGQRRVPSSFLDAYKVALPPIELQNLFAAFVELIDKSKLAVQNALAELETLKKALMQQYFG